ncbi:MAG: quinol:electron acceptor oxidoreductase subunit ActD [Vicinamibacterales bacterium]
MRAIYALFTGPDGAQQAVEALRGAGVADRDIVVMSSEPFEEYEFSQRDEATWLHWIAGAGAVAGLVLGYFLTAGTQQLWPLQTSGMPIVSTWPNTIVVFELTMLGAILSTAVALLVTASLPRRMPPLRPRRHARLRPRRRRPARPGAGREAVGRARRRARGGGEGG